jgi:peptidoglycan/xylan/chitin deacetylase (PgdA/CDA1 family)
VLTYHAIADLGDDPVLGSFSVPPGLFARQLDRLLRTGHRFIDGDQLRGVLAGESRLPRKPLLLTFDDCYRDLLDVALPLLRARGIPAIAFAVAGQVGGSNVWDQARGGERLELLDAAGLRTLAAHGVEIGAHGLTHRPLVDVPAGELTSEVVGSLDALEALGLPRPRWFAYPYGACNFRVFSAVVEAGLLGAFLVRPAVLDPHEGHFLLPRIVVFRSDGEWGVRWKLEAALLRERRARVRAVLRRLRRRLGEQARRGTGRAARSASGP